MRTIFYQGNFTRSGQPSVIITVEESETKFSSEKFIIFETFNNHFLFLSNKLNIDKSISAQNFDEYIKSEIQLCKSIIYCHFIYPNNNEESENKNIEIELTESEHNMLTNLIEKCPDIVNKINKLTQSENLRKLIKIHQEFIAAR